MALNTPFFRYVSPKTADILTRNHVKYFVEYIMPRSKDIIAELPVVSAFIKSKLNSGMTKEQVKEEMSKHKDLTGSINKVIVFENKSTNKDSHNYSRKLKSWLTNGGKAAPKTNYKRKTRKLSKK